MDCSDDNEHFSFGLFLPDLNDFRFTLEEDSRTVEGQLNSSSIDNIDDTHQLNMATPLQHIYQPSSPSSEASSPLTACAESPAPSATSSSSSVTACNNKRAEDSPYEEFLTMSLRDLRDHFRRNKVSDDEQKRIKSARRRQQNREAGKESRLRKTLIKEDCDATILSRDLQATKTLLRERDEELHATKQQLQAAKQQLRESEARIHEICRLQMPPSLFAHFSSVYPGMTFQPHHSTVVQPAMQMQPCVQVPCMQAPSAHEPTMQVQTLLFAHQQQPDPSLKQQLFHTAPSVSSVVV